MSSDSWTIGEVLRWTTGYFRGAGLASPRLDAECLLAHGLGLSRVDLYVRHDMPLGAAERAQVRELVGRRAKERVPVAYLTGEKEFYGLTLEVSPDVLIPRPETEALVDAALDRLRDRLEQGNGAPRVLDVGTGSGAVAVAVAATLPEVRVVAADISKEALEVAGRNVRRHGLSERVSLVCADLTDPFEGRGHFDLLVSNPPYVDPRDAKSLEPEISRHEPALALFSDGSGLDHVRRLLAKAAETVQESGGLLLELGSPEQVEDVLRLLDQDKRYTGPAPVLDLSRAPRGVQATVAAAGGSCRR